MTVVLRVSDKDLLAFREACGRIAYMRDSGRCMYCFWVRGRGVIPASETDHVFGRGSEYNLAPEHWLTRLSLCWDCHYQKHHGKDGWWDQQREEEALFQANARPAAGCWNPREIEAIVAPGMVNLLEESRRAAAKMVVDSVRDMMREQLGSYFDEYEREFHEALQCPEK